MTRSTTLPRKNPRSLTVARAAALLCLLPGWGCGRTAAEVGARTDAPAAPTHTTEAVSDEAFGEIAELIDPGVQPPLLDGIPAWVLVAAGFSEAGGGSDSAADLLAQSKAERARFDAIFTEGADGEDQFLTAIIAVGRAAVLAERAAAKGDAHADLLAQLAAVYAVIDAPLLASDRGLFTQFLVMFANAAEADSATAVERGQVEQLAGAVLYAVRAAAPLHRHTVAELLRADPHHPAVPGAMLTVARTYRGTDDALAVRMGRLAVQSKASTPKDQLALAQLCYAALDLECGDAALEQGADAKAEAITSAEETATLARRVVALRDATEVGPAVERARGLLELGQHARAKTQFQTLREAYPRDARPVAGLARHAMDTELDFMRANEIIDTAGPLENGDAEYFQIAIGTRATAMLGRILGVGMAGEWDAAMDIATPVLARMKADIEGYEALGETDGRYLRMVHELAVELLPLAVKSDKPAMVAMLRGVLPRAMKMQSEIPANPHAYQSLMAATLFSDDQALATKAARREPPAGDAYVELARRRARALADLAITWRSSALALEALNAAKTASTNDPRASMRLLADTHAIAAQLGDLRSWSQAQELYLAGLGDVASSSDAAALNNYAMTLTKAGDPKGAAEIWQRCTQMEGDYVDAAKLNLAVQSGAAKGRAAMKALAKDGKAADVRLAAHGWLLAWADTPAARKAAKKALAAAVEEEAVEAIRPGIGKDIGRFAHEGSVQAGLGYATQTGLQINLDTTGTPWLMFPPPAAD